MIGGLASFPHARTGIHSIIRGISTCLEHAFECSCGNGGDAGFKVVSDQTDPCSENTEAESRVVNPFLVFTCFRYVNLTFLVWYVI